MGFCMNYSGQAGVRADEWAGAGGQGEAQQDIPAGQVHSSEAAPAINGHERCCNLNPLFYP